MAAAVTDFLDGYIARRRRQITTFGKLMDPVADKLLISAAFICLVEMNRVPAWIVVLIVGREFAVSGLRYCALLEGITISASELGKSKMVMQVTAVAFLLVAPFHPLYAQAAMIALTLTVFLTVVSMYDYFRSFWGRLGTPAESQPDPGKLIVIDKTRKDVA